MEQIDNHASIAPSSAFQIVPCPGSILAQSGFPEEESEASKVGTASHWVGSSILQAFKNGNGSLLSSSFIDKTAPNGVIITEEMADGADMFIIHVLSIAQKYGLLQQMHIEERVNIPQVHPTECWGTPDAWLYDKENGVIYISDYKFGHRYVNVFENWQLICYALGALNSAVPDYTGRQDQHIKIVMTVAQPRYYRADPIRSWEVSASDLRGHTNQLQAAAAEALGPNPTLRPGPHCRDCRARHSCEGAQKAAMASIDISQNIQLIDYPAAALGTEIDMLKRAQDAIKFRLTGMEAAAIARINAGEIIPGVGLKNQPGRLNWDKPVSEVTAMGSLFGVDLSAAPAAITPTQAIKKGVDATVINQYSTRKSSLTLVTDTAEQAKRIFGKTTGD